MHIDSKKLDEVAALMERHGLSRVRIAEEDGRVVELERTAPQPAPAAPVAPVMVAAPATAPAAPAAVPAPAAPAVATDAEPADEAPLDMASTHEVAAPMVGVFYAAPSPGAEPFVKVGSKVRRGDTLCVIEAMKLMNEVVAECDGEVVDICVKDGELVEYGACLMKINEEAAA